MCERGDDYDAHHMLSLTSSYLATTSLSDVPNIQTSRADLGFLSRGLSNDASLPHPIYKLLTLPERFTTSTSSLARAY